MCVDGDSLSPGLILYNGHMTDGTGDFISLGMRDGRVEFRLDVGSGPAVITSEPVGLDQWYTVRIRRDGRNGNMNIYTRNYFDRLYFTSFIYLFCRVIQVL